MWRRRRYSEDEDEYGEEEEENRSKPNKIDHSNKVITNLEFLLSGGEVLFNKYKDQCKIHIIEF